MAKKPSGNAHPINTPISLTLSRLQGGADSDKAVFHLVCTDEVSRKLVFETRFSAEVLADLLSTRLARCTGTLFHAAEYGKKMETKFVFVPLETETWSDGALPGIIKRARALAGPDWTVDNDNTWNNHRVVGGTYRITARRWV